MIKNEHAYTHSNNKQKKKRLRESQTLKLRRQLHIFYTHVYRDLKFQYKELIRSLMKRTRSSHDPNHIIHGPLRITRYQSLSLSLSLETLSRISSHHFFLHPHKEKEKEKDPHVWQEPNLSSKSWFALIFLFPWFHLLVNEKIVLYICIYFASDSRVFIYFP